MAIKETRVIIGRSAACRPRPPSLKGLILLLRARTAHILLIKRAVVRIKLSRWPRDRTIRTRVTKWVVVHNNLNLSLKAHIFHTRLTQEPIKRIVEIRHRSRILRDHNKVEDIRHLGIYQRHRRHYQAEPRL